MTARNVKIDYYQILGVARDCGFQELKRAYYRRAKECHPDLFKNSSLKTEEFKQLVMAFDVLSDQSKRYRYNLDLKTDEELAVMRPAAVSTSIMDSEADDVLEELIVGNTCPVNTSLATLFMDLQKTDIFITFREGKDLYQNRRFRAARSFLQNAVSRSPHNILYRVFLARDLRALRDYKLARLHYREALAIGQRREPPQALLKIKRELDDIARRGGLLRSLFSGTSEAEGNMIIEDSDREMIAQTNRSLTRLARMTFAERKKPPKLEK